VGRLRWLIGAAVVIAVAAVSLLIVQVLVTDDEGADLRAVIECSRNESDGSVAASESARRCAQQQREVVTERCRSYGVDSVRLEVRRLDEEPVVRNYLCSQWNERPTPEHITPTTMPEQ
jgi:hypothetical protein